MSLGRMSVLYGMGLILHVTETTESTVPGALYGVITILKVTIDRYG